MVGVDFPHYLSHYYNPASRQFEIGFQSVAEGMSSLGIHYSWYFGFWAFLQIALLYYAFRNERYLFPWFAFFLIFGSGYMSWMNVIRHQVAACIFLVSIEYIDKKQPFRYYLLILVAFLFHKSSILLVVVYPLMRWRRDLFQRPWVQFVILAAAVFLGKRYDIVVNLIEKPFVLFTSLAGYDNYLVGILTNETLNDKSQFGRNTGFGLYAKLLKVIPIICYSIPMKRYYHSDRFNIAYSFWFIAIFVSFAFQSSIILSRPFTFFYNFGTIIMPAYFLNFCFKQRNKVRLVVAAMMIALYLVLFLNIVSNGEMSATAFHFFWENRLPEY